MGNSNFKSKHFVNDGQRELNAAIEAGAVTGGGQERDIDSLMENRGGVLTTESGRTFYVLRTDDEARRVRGLIHRFRGDKLISRAEEDAFRIPRNFVEVAPDYARILLNIRRVAQVSGVQETTEAVTSAARKMLGVAEEKKPEEPKVTEVPEKPVDAERLKQLVPHILGKGVLVEADGKAALFFADRLDAAEARRMLSPVTEDVRIKDITAAGHRPSQLLLPKSAMQVFQEHVREWKRVAATSGDELGMASAAAAFFEEKNKAKKPAEFITLEPTEVITVQAVRPSTSGRRSEPAEPLQINSMQECKDVLAREALLACINMREFHFTNAYMGDPVRARVVWEWLKDNAPQVLVHKDQKPVPFDVRRTRPVPVAELQLAPAFAEEIMAHPEFGDRRGEFKGDSALRYARTGAGVFFGSERISGRG